MTITKKISAAVLVPVMALAVLLGGMPATASADSNSKIRVEAPSIAVNADGKMIAKQAKVTSVSGSVINASVTLGSGTMNWTVNVDSATKFYNRTGSAGVLADIAVGDMITFGGTLEGSNLSVKAVAVKDMTGAVSNATLSGKAESVNSAGLSIVLDKSKSVNGEDRKVVVQTNAATTITLNNVVALFSNILAGDKVKATGTLSADGTTLAATSLVVTRSSSSDDRNFNSFFKNWFKGERKHD